MSCFKRKDNLWIIERGNNPAYSSSEGYSPGICKHCICDFRCGQSKISSSGFLTIWGLPQTPDRREVKHYGTAQT